MTTVTQTKEEKILERFGKMKIALKYQLLSKNYLLGLKAFKLANKHHSGKRKDGITPEFQHQIEIALYILTLKGIQNEEAMLSAALLHDIREDYGIEHSDIVKEFGFEIAEAVEVLTKKFKGSNKTYNVYFEELSKNSIGSIVKGVDRINNLNSMFGVFSKEKQIEYAKMVDDHFLPMLKTARENYPEQSYAYLNIETVLRQLSRIVKEIHNIVEE